MKNLLHIGQILLVLPPVIPDGDRILTLLLKISMCHHPPKPINLSLELIIRKQIRLAHPPDQGGSMSDLSHECGRKHLPVAYTRHSISLGRAPEHTERPLELSMRGIEHLEARVEDVVLRVRDGDAGG